MNPVFEVLERSFTVERLQRTQRARLRWQADFDLALMAQRFLTIDDLSKDLDSLHIASLFQKWNRLGVSCFVVFSGFWLPILDRYLDESASKSIIECIQMDSVMGHSWTRYFRNFRHPAQVRWLFSAQDTTGLRTMTPATPMVTRSTSPTRSLISHGGGWQIGDYRNALCDLEKAGYQVIAAVPDPADVTHSPKSSFSIDRSWQPWSRSEPMLVPHILRAGDGNEWYPAEEAWFSHVMQNSNAIVSKPGGGTLLDSLKFAIPIVFCTPYGQVEEQNARLWTDKGFGLSLSDWEKSGYDHSLLETLHRNVVESRKSLRPSVAELLYEQ
jgi:hypothetical protein